MIPFERDDGKALVAIFRAFRASLSQRRWESHQPQEERHSRYLPHLQATQQIPASPSRRDPASSEVLGGEVLVPWQRRARRLSTAGQRRARPAKAGSPPVLSCPLLSCPLLSAPVLSAPVPSCPVPHRLPQARGGKGRVRGSVHRRMLRAGVPLPARTCLYLRLFRWGGGGASRRSRTGCRASQDGDALTDRAPEGLRAAPLRSDRLRSAAGSGLCPSCPGQRTAAEPLELGAGALPREGMSQGSPGSAPAPEPGARDSRRSPFGRFCTTLRPQPHSPGRMPQRKRTLLRFSASSPLLSSI